MALNELMAISPVDGRYRKQICQLENYFSEFALIKYRVFVEIEYFIKLVEIPLPELSKFPKTKANNLRNIYKNFDITEAEKIKVIEQKTNHDVKSVEIYLRNKFDETGLGKYKEFIHFGLTSQDINNSSVPLSLKACFDNEYIPAIDSSLKILKMLSKEWKNISMLAHTHGQPASPTKAGKEILVFVERIESQLKLLKSVPFTAKFGGATGNFNAHNVAYPKINWTAFADKFVNDALNLKRTRITTQIEPYDNLAAFFDNLKRINNILIDLCRDIWTYISMEYLGQKINPDEVGSSAMPHKVNPIDFENAEGNFGMANAIFEHLSAKLPISRLQRDLTDSTVLRNIGVPIAHTLIGFRSLTKGLGKIQINTAAMENDLNANWSVVAEAIQTILRRENYPDPYNELKKLTRINKKLDKQTIHKFIDTLKVSEQIKKELKKITPFNYTGKA